MNVFVCIWYCRPILRSGTRTSVWRLSIKKRRLYRVTPTCRSLLSISRAGRRRAASCSASSKRNRSCLRKSRKMPTSHWSFRISTTKTHTTTTISASSAERNSPMPSAPASNSNCGKNSTPSKTRSHDRTTPSLRLWRCTA